MRRGVVVTRTDRRIRQRSDNVAEHCYTVLRVVREVELDEAIDVRVTDSHERLAVAQAWAPSDWDRGYRTTRQRGTHVPLR